MPDTALFGLHFHAV